MKKILFSSCLLAACLTACNNEDVLNESPIQNITEETSVVGADLVSHGMKININGNEASTRVTDEGNWQADDQVGLAWYNFKNGGNITAVQDKNDWNAGSFGSDMKLYANHIFTVENVNGVDQFTTMTDVYQGAYFIYFPYERLGGVKEKYVEFNAAPQTGDFDFERYNKAFRISTQDFISANEAVGENNELEKAFALKMAVSPLKVDVTPSEEIKGNTYFQGVKVTKLQISAGGNAATSLPFITKAKLNPNGLPKVVRDRFGEIDYSASYQAIFEAATNKSFIEDGTKTTASTLITNVENDAYTLDEARSVRAFVYPLNSLVAYTSTQYPTATVTVSKTQNGKTWIVGTFAVNNINSKGFAEKLRSYLSDGSNAVSQAPIQLNKILSNGDNVGYLNLSGDAAANLELANFTPTLTITSVDQWNDMVALYNALDELGAIDKLAAAYKKPTFTWAGTEAFNGEIQTPENVEVKLKTTKPMVIEGEVTWPKNLITDGDESITVNGTLHVGETEEVTINAELTNNGIIYAGQFASIGTKNDDANNNTVINSSRIYVTYGAYVYPKQGNEGEIAYIVDNNDKSTINKIAKLVKKGTSSTQQNYANVNLLVIQNTTLDLNAEGDGTSGSDDRYETTTGQTVMMPNLQDVAIELNNGNIEKVLEGNNTKVKSVKTVGGENSITDVQINRGDITIAEQTTLAINSVVTPVKATILGITDIVNKGTLNANTNVETTNIDNTFGTINVASNYAITYKNTYKQGGTVHGTVNKQ